MARKAIRHIDQGGTKMPGKAYTVRIDDTLMKRAKHVAVEQERTVSSIIEGLLEEYIQTFDKKEKKKKEGVA